MNKTDLQHFILDAKKAKGLTWNDLTAKVGLSPLYIASCCYGENSMTPESAEKLCTALGVTDSASSACAALTEYPTKGNSLAGNLVPTDPLMYRFYEILLVYGTALKDVIQEQFGDGIMSAIDFTMDVKKVENPKGDRVVITMDGKFLPYRRF